MVTKSVSARIAVAAISASVFQGATTASRIEQLGAESGIRIADGTDIAGNKSVRQFRFTVRQWSEQILVPDQCAHRGSLAGQHSIDDRVAFTRPLRQCD